MNRNINIALTALAVLTSCSKVEVEVPAPFQGENKEIGFNVANLSAATKAAYDQDSFGTYAFYTGDESWASINFSNAVVYMDDVQITNHDGVWKSATGRYCWPKTGMISFASYSPKSASLELGSSKDALLNATAYEVTDEDLLISKFTADQSGNNVPTLFFHALSEVRFQTADSTINAQGLRFEAVINSVEVADINTVGDLSYNSLNNHCTWSNQTATDTKDVTDGNFFLALPQQHTSAMVIVNYTVKTYQGETLVDTLNDESGVALSTLGISSWESNTRYTYKVRVNPLSSDPITFEPAVASWMNAESTYLL